jgi:D-tagatose-1,6-bisphosphate aldolase subunit GatZ/KbaZ
VVEACLRNALDSDDYILIESTSNQVNQFGGYTGMTPAQFAGFLYETADRVGFPRERILLGGDHLGPNVWQREPADEAMQKSYDLVADCVRAGYSKIHLDASMRLADDPQDIPLATKTSALRAAKMCQAAEAAYAAAPNAPFPPVYIIGTEVPIPGGALSGENEVHVTLPKDAKETIEITQAAFHELGLESAWERVIGLVVQPGVEFGDSSLIVYDRENATRLSKFIEGYDHLVFEAHSTDYQSSDGLRQMVEDHFAILKVGPALTFAMREAVFALDMMEQEWLGGKEGIVLSNVQEVLEQVMLDQPGYWNKYYEGDENDLRLARKYSYSDRLRYYWPNEKVDGALEQLIANLKQVPVPLNLLSQFLPQQYRKVMDGELSTDPVDLIFDKIQMMVSDYTYACQCHL